MSENMTGQVLADRYEIQTQHAEEMLGRVYLARDRKTGALVHVKVLHPYLTQNVEKVRRFGREVTATSAVRHPNSVAVLDHGESGDLHWLVLEYFPSTTLQEEVEKKGALSVDRTVHIGAQIASALAAAHKEGIVHRNLNPGNILLLQNAHGGDYVKVRDFGLSRLQAPDEESGGGDGFEDDGGALTTAGARIGNTFYMAPEYIEEQLVDPRGDVYALGGILVFCLTEHPPFTGRPGQVLEKHLTERPTPVSKERSDVPPWLDEFVMNLLGKNPRKRPGADSVHDALERNHGRKLDPPKLLALDADGKPVPPSAVESLMSGKGAAIGIAAVATVVIGVGIGLAVLLGLYFFVL